MSVCFPDSWPRDGYTVATLSDQAFDLLSPHVGLIYVDTIIAVLMRRMIASFEQLDRSNETLSLRLAEREAEPAVLGGSNRRRRAARPANASG